MFYIIDYDTGTIESKSKTETPLLKYITQNKLELSVALISSPEEICLKLSLREMKRIWSTYGNKSTLKNEQQGSECVFNILETRERQTPTFNKKLGQRLIKAAKQRCPDVRPKKAAIKLSKTNKTVKQLCKRFREETRKETSQLKSIFGKFK